MLSSLACCAGMTCCQATCNSLMSCCDCKGRPAAAKAGYLALLMVSGLFALIMKSNGSQLVVGKDFEFPLFGKFDYTYGCVGDNAGLCVGNAVVYRVSFSLATFFAAMALITKVFTPAHTRGWLVKIVCIIALVFGTFYIPNEFFFTYSVWSRWLSAIFLVLQLVALIDMAYTWNERWVEAEEERKILSLSCLLYLASAAGVLLFFWYYPCGSDIVFSLITLTAICAFSYLSIMVEHGAILPSAFVAGYVTFLCWSALESRPENDTCRGSQSASDEDKHDVSIGIISALFACASLAYTTYSASNSALVVFHTDGRETSAEEREALQAPLTGGAKVDDGHDDGENDADEEEGKEGKRVPEAVEAASDESAAAKEDAANRGIWVFHLVMMFGSIYMAMLLTAWGDESSAAASGDGDISIDSGDKGHNSMWAKIISQWMTILLYIWTLVAPSLFPDRDFS